MLTPPYKTLLLRLVTPALATSFLAFGQSTSRYLPDSLSGVALPISTGVLGQKDIGALTELAHHRAAIGAAPWVGMQGTGKITFASQGSAYDATLSNLGSDMFRLDAQTTEGQTSLRIHGRAGKIQEGDGTASLIPSDTAALGLFPFELLRSARLPGAEASLIDHGLIVVGGTELHRITYERATIGRNPATKARETIAIDFYFDPTSHFLIRSANTARVAGSRPVDFLFVVNYGDYRKVGDLMIPFLYTETMEGRPYRTLQLSDIQLNPALNSTSFEF